ncbi:hypothetical protein [Phocaeicola plebeius]|uniref:hypothetical protein n=1 Tax=Phocaeicola plebeius TaxID=310297 RepID=UPI00307AFE7B
MNRETRYILDHIDQVLNGHTNEEAKEVLEELRSEIDIKIESCEEGTYTVTSE